jgi:hypothetical protein
MQWFSVAPSRQYAFTAVIRPSSSRSYSQSTEHVQFVKHCVDPSRGYRGRRTGTSFSQNATFAEFEYISARATACATLNLPSRIAWAKSSKYPYCERNRVPSRSLSQLLAHLDVPILQGDPFLIQLIRQPLHVAPAHADQRFGIVAALLPAARTRHLITLRRIQFIHPCKVR